MKKKQISLANYNLLSDKNMGEVDGKLMLGSCLNEFRYDDNANYIN